MNLERTMAERALVLVRSQRQDKFDQAESEYRALCESFPVLLRTAGLLQAAAFLRAKGGHPHGTLYDHLSEQLRRLRLLEDRQELVDVLADAAKVPPRVYRMYTQMTARVAHWHKRMSQAWLRTKKEGDGQ